ncbi:MAG: ATP-dependent helicase [bacterium]
MRPETTHTPAPVPWQTDLNEEQRNAVSAPEKHVLVLAGAGSGKTRVITYRLAWILHCGVPIEQCFMATFSNKAAREMLHRVETLLQKPTQGLWGGTFHSLCARLLRKEAQRVGYSDRFTILDSEDASEIMQGVRAELLTNPSGTRFPQAAVLSSIHSLSQNTLRHPGEILAERYPQFLELGDTILAMIQAYQVRKRALNAMDYDDLLQQALLVLTEYDEVCHKWALHFRHLLVDEYQDTNHAQGALIDRLATEGAHVTVVGDDAQAIYAFRGADYRNILTFPDRYPDTAIYRLETNYRSTPPILALANALFRDAPEHFRKTLRPVKKAGFRPALVACRDDSEEAMFIASRILDLREEGASLRDMGILLRSNATAMQIELELRKRRIPFMVRGGVRFMEQAHIKDVLAHLIVTVNGQDELSWQRLFKLQKKVGPKKSAELWASLQGQRDPFASFLDGVGGNDSLLEGLRSALHGIRNAPPSDAIAAVTESGYRDVVYAKYPNPKQRLEDLAQLAQYAAKFPETYQFLEDIALLGGLSAEDLMATEDPDEKLTLSTIHQAKGLEWPIVFIPGAVEGLLPHWLAIKEGNREEERRLLYVAITRAQEELYLSHPQMRYNRGTPVLNMLTSFLTELGDLDELVDVAVVEMTAPKVEDNPAVPEPKKSFDADTLDPTELVKSLDDASSPFEE